MVPSKINSNAFILKVTKEFVRKEIELTFVGEKKSVCSNIHLLTGHYRMYGYVAINQSANFPLAIFHFHYWIKDPNTCTHISNLPTNIDMRLMSVWKTSQTHTV